MLLGLQAFPHLLPASAVNAPSGKRIANHVVFCLFAGGIRNFESIDMAEGNLMPHILSGNNPIAKDIADGIEQLPGASDIMPLQKFGTLYKQFRYNSSKTIHYTAHAASITGVYASNVQLMRPLNFPSVFEYYRKHSSPSPSALNAWWVSDQAGPFAFLNYSDYQGYGPLYGANMLQPTSFLNSRLNGFQQFNDKDFESVSNLQTFFNRHAQIRKSELSSHEIENNIYDRLRIEKLLSGLNQEYFTSGFYPWQMGKGVNGDIVTMHAATRVLSTFKPELLVVNMQHSDIGHSNFTQYCNNMHKASFAVSQLWNTIQSDPVLKDDTILIIAPEFGRNSEPNNIVDAYGKLAVDHTGDENSKHIFCMIAGPPNLVKQNQVVNEVAGESIDIVPTIAKILGFDSGIPKDILNGRFLHEAFV